MELSQSESATLTAVCDALFPSVGGESEFYRRKASDMSVDALMKEAIENSLQPGSAKDLCRVLRVIESPLYNVILARRPTKFSDLGTDAKERYLEAWRDSPLPLKRVAFQGLKRLALFIAYASVGPGGRNPNWDDIGYPGPQDSAPVPVKESLRLKPLLLQADTALTCDVVVIGSGAGGSVIAAELASAGWDVIVVEQGPYETSETFRQDEMRMMQRLFQQSGTAATKDLSFVLLAGQGAGGGTTVNWNTCLRPPARVLSEWENDFGIAGTTGPIFQSYLDEVWNALEVNVGDSQLNMNNGVLWDGCKALGYREGADFRVIERNAVGCRQRCDYCTFGCRYAAKRSTAMNFLPSAQSHGARIVFDTRVEEIEIVGGVARGVVATSKSSGRPVRLDIKSRVVVVASGGIETPALLLRSGVNDRNVGRYLRLDPTVALGGIFEKRIDPWRGPPQTVAVWKFIDMDGSYHGFWIEAAPAHPGLFALSIPWASGKQHKEFMKQYYSRSSASIVLLRERSSGRVSIDRDGYPVVSYELGGADKETLVRGMEETARILAAAGAVGVWTTHNDQLSAGDGKNPINSRDIDAFAAALKKRGVHGNRMMLYSAHIMGSCRMSADPASGPTSPTGEMHTVQRLYVGDACVFPTTPAVNPMISIMAMSRRTAESIKTALRAR